MSLYRYYVQVPGGRPLAVPLNHPLLRDLYFSTIQKLTGHDAVTARRILHEGIEIEVEGSRPVVFWAVDLTRGKVVQMPWAAGFEEMA